MAKVKLHSSRLPSVRKKALVNEDSGNQKYRGEEALKEFDSMQCDTSNVMANNQTMQKSKLKNP